MVLIKQSRVYLMNIYFIQSWGFTNKTNKIPKKNDNNKYIFLLTEVSTANIKIALPTFYPFALVMPDYFSMYFSFNVCFLAISSFFF